MQILEKLDNFKGKFECPVCGDIVIRGRYKGRDQKNCGCVRRAQTIKKQERMMADFRERMGVRPEPDEDGFVYTNGWNRLIGEGPIPLDEMDLSE